MGLWAPLFTCKLCSLPQTSILKEAALWLVGSRSQLQTYVNGCVLSSPQGWPDRWVEYTSRITKTPERFPAPDHNVPPPLLKVFTFFSLSLFLKFCLMNFFLPLADLSWKLFFLGWESVNYSLPCGWAGLNPPLLLGRPGGPHLVKEAHGKNSAGRKKDLFHPTLCFLSKHPLIAFNSCGTYNF